MKQKGTILLIVLVSCIVVFTMVLNLLKLKTSSYNPSTDKRIIKTEIERNNFKVIAETYLKKSICDASYNMFKAEIAQNPAIDIHDLNERVALQILGNSIISYNSDFFRKYSSREFEIYENSFTPQTYETPKLVYYRYSKDVTEQYRLASIISYIISDRKGKYNINIRLICFCPVITQEEYDKILSGEEIVLNDENLVYGL